MRQPLSRQTVLDGALRLADAEGLQAVTMRRLASDLGAGAMSLYHHVPGKDGLYDGLVEALVGEIRTELEGVGKAEDWRTELRNRCLAARRVMVRHPWGPAFIGSRTSIPVSMYAYFEDVLAILVRGGLSYSLAHRALHSLGSMVLGFAQELFSVPAQGDASETAADEAEDQLAQMAAVLPHLAAMVEAELHSAEDPTLGWCDSQTEFEFTLDLLLDGLERRREQEAGTTMAPDRVSAGQGPSSVRHQGLEPRTR